MTYDLIVFDIAGTTVDDGEAVGGCLAAAARDHFGLAPTRAEVNAVMGIAKPAAIRQLLADKGVVPAAGAVEAAHADFVARMVRTYRDGAAARPMPGAADAFRALRDRGVKVALDTGFDRPIADALLGSLGWAAGGGLIDAVATSDEVPAGRPAPYMIFRLMERLGVTSVGRVVKVGDTPSDLYEGANAGCGRIVGITHGTHTAAELRAHPHTDLAGSLAEVLALLDRGPGLGGNSVPA